MRQARRSRLSMQYGSYTIPAGTGFSMAAYYVLSNSTIFPSPDIFNPSRWLADPVTGELPKAPNGKLLTRYLVTFSRGTRRCLGINMAYAELYTVIANVFRKCDLQLHETTLKDVSFYKENFLPAPYPDSKGVRVVVM